jgi:hypothetical protein
MSPLEEFLAGALRAGTVACGGARTSLKSGGRTHATSVTGMASRLLMVSPPSGPPAVTGQAGVLSIELEDGAVRVDQPVMVVASGERGVVLRAMSQPLVLRRRVVHDQSIAQALGVRVPPAPALASCATPAALHAAA